MLQDSVLIDAKIQLVEEVSEIIQRYSDKIGASDTLAGIMLLAKAHTDFVFSLKRMEKDGATLESIAAEYLEDEIAGLVNPYLIQFGCDKVCFSLKRIIERIKGSKGND